MSTRYQGGIVTANASTGYSVSFNGSAILTTTPGTTAIGFGTGNFTIEVWCYSNRLSDALCVFWAKSAGTSYDFILRYNGTTAWEIYSQTSGGRIIYDWTSPEQSGFRCWVHHAIVRSGTILKWYINGVDVSVGGITQTTNYSTNYVEMGSHAGYYWDGFISNFRMVKGTALYTSNFTPPTQLRPITGTGLLTCNQAKIGDQSSFNSTIDAIGTTPPTVSLFSPFPAQSYNSPELGSNSAGIWTLDQLGQARATRQLNLYDQQSGNNALMLHGEGANSQTNATFVDSSPNNFSVTTNGNITQASFGPYGKAWSWYFTGITGTPATVRTESVTAPGTGSFTLECWFFAREYNTSIGAAIATIMDTATSSAIAGSVGIAIDYDYAATYSALIVYNGNSGEYVSDGIVLKNVWNHVAVVRNGSTNVSVYINGVLSYVTTFSTNFNVTGFCVGGSAFVGGRAFTGFIANARYVRGVAVYTSNFTPSFDPLPSITGTEAILCQSKSFVDVGPNNLPLTVSNNPSVYPFSAITKGYEYSAKQTGGSANFSSSGTPQYLEIADSPNLELGSSDFTIEGWVYFDVYPAGSSAVVSKGSSFGSYLLNIVPFAGNIAFIFYFSYDGSSWAGSVNFNDSSNIKIKTWVHLAVTRSGDTIRTFLNGQFKNSVNVGSNALHDNSLPLNVGRYPAGGVLDGRLSDVRIIKGTALYTATFTPPTAPLAPVTNTQLLLSFANAGVYDSTGQNMLRLVSGASVSTDQKKFGNSSLYLNGTGYALLPAYPTIQLGQMDLTVECWVYPTTGTLGTICSFGNNTASASGISGILIQRTAGAVLSVRFSVDGTTAGATITGTTSILANAWTHIAVVRRRNQYWAFVNGIAQGSPVTLAGVLYVGNQTDGTYNSYNIGGVFVNNAIAQRFTGYIDDFRFTRGVARYVGNFTPPTSQLQDT